MDRREFYRNVPRLFARAQSVAWEQYEETLFHMRRPVTHGNYHRVKQFVGGNPPNLALRDAREYPELDRILSRARYPRAGQLTRLNDFAEGSTEFASALLHFNNPAYPLYDANSIKGLTLLGYRLDFARVISDGTHGNYQTYITKIQELKDEIPFPYVPEKNYYLTRIIQQALWQLGVDSPAPVRTRKPTRPRSAPASR